MKKNILFLVLFIGFVCLAFGQTVTVHEHSNDFEQICTQFKQRLYVIYPDYNSYNATLDKENFPVLEADNKKIVGEDDFFILSVSGKEIGLRFLFLCNNKTKTSVGFVFAKELLADTIPCSLDSINSHLMAYLIEMKPDNFSGSVFTWNVYEQAIVKHSATLKKNPRDYEALLQRGVAYFQMGEFDKAITDYTAALKIKPNNPDILFNRAIAYHKNNNQDKAIIDYTALLKINPNDSDALMNRGSAYYEKGNLDKAITDWEALLQLEPENNNIRGNIEILRQQMKVQ